MLSRQVLIFSCLSLVVGLASASDWPMYQHDIARSGVTAEQVKPPLSMRWELRPRHAPDPAWEDPKPMPVEGYLELPRMKFDDTFHVAVAGNSVYFGSSADHKLYCIDAATGRERWSVITGGPIRFTPQIVGERLYAVSDDGYVYCLQVGDGKEIWKVRIAPKDDRVLGNGKMISLWPPRSGVLVDKGVAYCTAGMFPAEGVHVCALNADDGSIIWRNGTSGQAFQGYLLASDTTLFAPQGRVSPCGYSRESGKLTLSRPYFGKGTGGSWALLVDGQVVSGSEQIMAYDQRTRGAFAWFPGRKLVVTPDASYMASDTEMWAIKRKEYPKASLAYRSAKAQRVTFQRTHRSSVAALKRKQNALTAGLKQSQAKLEELKKQFETLKQAEQPDQEQTTAIGAQVEKMTASQTAQNDELEGVEKEIADRNKQAEEVDANVAAKYDGMLTARNWHIQCAAPHSMICAGGVIFAGGEDKVVAIDVADGNTLWSQQVDGKAKGLAVANAHLYVSTTTGAIYCFGAEGTPALGEIAQPTEPSPYRRDALTPVFEAAAEQIVRDTGITKGYCLVLGSGTGRLALELAKRTDLHIYGVDSQAENVEAARKALDRAGLYGQQVCFGSWPLTNVPYSDYFANLIVSETALVSGPLPGDAREAFRMLRPLGGTIYIGQPATASGKVKPTRASDLQSWSVGIKGAQIVKKGGRWLEIIRGRLEGSADWTHEYADAGNTTCSMDDLVRCPLGILWFGSPGPTDIVNRHASAAAPLCVNGVLFVQGENVLMGYDAYNGLKLWRREVPGAMRTALKGDCGNLVASDDSFFVALQNGKCLRIGPATGETTMTYDPPKAADGAARGWGYIAFMDGLLLGSTQTYRGASDGLFAVDPETGKLVWQALGSSMRSMAIAAGDGRIFFIDHRVTDEHRKRAIRERLERFDGLKGDELQTAVKGTKSADVRLVVALDAATGKRLWERPLDTTNCVRISKGGGDMGIMYRDGVVLLCAQPWNGHFWKEFFAGGFSRRSLIALSARDGKLLWSKKAGYRSRPLIVDQTVIAEPWACDLRTGKPKMRTSPVTGKRERWQMSRPGHHCGPIAASKHTLVFRSGVIGWYDLTGDGGTVHFAGQRTGCHVNFISANGLLLIPEGSSGCMCPFPTHCTVVLKHRKKDRGWTRFSLEGLTKPVKSFALNLGAPGDRRGKNGKIWLSYPRPGRGRLMLDFTVETPGGQMFRYSPDVVEVERSDNPWLFASGHRALRSCIVPLVEPGDGTAQYTVRLHFADLDNDEPGQRVFDVSIQGQPVLKDFDIVAETGGRNRAIVKEFAGIKVDEKLRIDFQPKPEQTAILQAVEIVREKVLSLGFTVPSYLLNNVEREQTGEVRIANHKDDDFAGTLVIEAPKGFAVTPSETKVKIETGSAEVIALKASVKGNVEAGFYPVKIRLVRSDGKPECERSTQIEHLADRGRVTLNPIEDVHCQRSNGSTNCGSHVSMNVDGGDAKMGDHHHAVAYLKFRLDIPGKPLSAVLRIHNAGNRSGSAGRICLVTDPWSEKKAIYANRPAMSEELARIGRVRSHETKELPLKLSLEGLKELSLGIDATSCDGVNYISREGQKPPELVVEYEPK